MVATRNIRDITNLALGGTSTTARFTTFTQRTDVLDGDVVYHYADQTNAANQQIGRVEHIYNDGVAAKTDVVGSGTAHIWVQATNSAARSDKAAGYVGTGKIWQAWRSLVGSPTGGNLGNGNDLGAELDASFCLNIRGSNIADWTGGDTTAPLKLTGFSNYNQRLYGGFYTALGKGVLGVINSGTAFLPLQLAVSKIEVNADNTVELATASNRLKEIFCANATINTSDEREKIWRGAASAAEIRAARRIIGELGFYQWKASVEGVPEAGMHPAVDGKGDAARLHYGVRAQKVWGIMADEGLVDPIGKDGKPGKTPYAFLCFDEWEDEVEDIMEEYEVSGVTTGTDFVRDEAGVPVKNAAGEYDRVESEHPFTKTETRPSGKTRVVTPAGNRYGVRPDQLTLFLIAAQEARLAALEAG